MYNTSIRIVMKKAFILIIAAVATIACTKETNVQDKNLALDGGLLSIEATISPFVDDATKASISIDGNGEITGTFSWSEGDQIAFPVTASGSPTYVALTYNTETKRFEGNLEDGQEVNYSGTIYYPASVVIGPTYSTSFASIDAAKAGFKMTAPVPSPLSQKVTMTHQSALVHVQFTNVPDFADELVVNDGSSNIATIPASEGTVDFYVPVTPAGEKTYTFTLEDNKNNAIKKVSKTTTLVTGKYYNTPSVSVGRIISIYDEANKGWGELAIWQVSNDSNNYRFKISNDYPSKLNTLSANHYYAVLNDLAWATSGVDLGISYEEYYGGSGCSTSKVYLDRALSFKSTDISKLKAPYRIYAKPNYDAVPSSMYIYAYENWGGKTTIAGTWPGTLMTTSSARSGYYYWDLPESYFNYNNLAFIFKNGDTGNQAGDGDGDSPRIPDTSTTFDHDVTITFDHFWKESTTFNVD